MTAELLALQYQRVMLNIRLAVAIHKQKWTQGYKVCDELDALDKRLTQEAANEKQALLYPR